MLTSEGAVSFLSRIRLDLEPPEMGCYTNLIVLYQMSKYVPLEKPRARRIRYFFKVTYQFEIAPLA